MSGTEIIEESTAESDAIILEESQRVLDHQIDNIKSVDVRITWTLRIGLVLLGVLISGARLLGVSSMGVLGQIGFGSVLLSLAIGVITYGVSDIDVGAKPDALEQDMPDDYASHEVYNALLAAHEDSIGFNSGTLRVNEWLLTLTQGLLVGGVSLIVAGLLMSV